MIQKFLNPVLILITGFITFSCTSETEDPLATSQEPVQSEQTEEPVIVERKEISLPQAERDMVDVLNSFGIQFTADACRYIDSRNSPENTNIVCSPLGTEFILSIIANGVDDTAKDEILRYLSVSDIETLNSLNRILIEALPTADISTKMNISNALWFNTNLVNGLNNDFASIFSNKYSGDINNSNFYTQNKETINQINKWGSETTNGLIPNFLEKLDTDLLAIMVNSWYFKGLWYNKPFNPESTTKGIFHGNTKDTEIEMMRSNTISCRYNADNDFEYFVLPYGNKAFAMHILLPKDTESEASINDLITWERLQRMEKNASSYQLQITMPKFKCESRLNLSDLFSNAGVMKGLGGEVGFTMFDKSKNGILKFNQALSLSVDESGAEAAAITWSGAFESAGEESAILKLALDRPFYFFIQEFSTGAIMMSGRISDL